MADDDTSSQLNVEGADLLTLAGVNDANLVELARQTGVRVSLRGDALTLTGSAESISRAQFVAQRMIDTARQRLPLDPDDVLRLSLEPTPRNGTDAGPDSAPRRDGRTIR